MLKTVSILLKLLNKEQKYMFYFIVGLSVLAALSEMISIVLIVPLVSLILNVDRDIGAFDNVLPYFIFLDKAPSGQTLILITAFFIFLAIAIKSLNVVLMQRFVLGLEAALSIGLLDRTLKKSYAGIARKGSAHYTKVLTTEIGQVIYNGYFPLLNLLTNFSIVCLIAMLLLYANWKLALFLLIVFCVCYATIYRVMQAQLALIGSRRVDANKMRFKVVADLFASLKYVFTDNKQFEFVQLFRSHAQAFAKYQALSQIIAILPRYLVELFLFMLLFGYLSWSVFSSNAMISKDVPVIVMYIYAAYRLMPAAQMTFASASQLTFGGSIVSLVSSELNDECQVEVPRKKIQEFRQLIEFRNVGYSIHGYSILKDVSCEIYKGETVGVVGKSGAGKSTFIDIISGVSQYTEGRIVVDGNTIPVGVAPFESQVISYVPQQTLLLDDSLQKNIEFFRPHDESRFLQVMNYARLSDIIANSDDREYEIGERGSNLSGGQAQRIGIARALFKNSDILLLDEATSALDSVNEQSIIANIFNMAPAKTILVVSHNLELIKECDKILFFSDGCIEQVGSFEELVKSNKNFRELAKEYQNQ